ncbi:PhzF family phenazine biosynthesis protein [Thioclava sp. GXIMD4215]|uniref:PhzF family phenazine biosynthesis protein n=1 Tax=Thioclava sp. GXIMD4215 TaxID=3131928 RepID=UPI0032432AB5
MAGSSTRAFVTLDVFTTTPFAGNPLALLPDATGLSDAQMQTIAREFNLSETIFVFPPADPAHRARVRIFYPQGEMSFAGHPTIGCAIFLALEDLAPDTDGADFDRVLVLEEEAGLVPVRVWREAGEIRAEFQAPVLPECLPDDLPQSAAPDRCAAALGLGPADLDDAPLAVIAGGPRFAFIGLRDTEALARAWPVQPAFDLLQTELAAAGVYLYAPTGAYRWQGRMFDPMGGIPEDPATGSATALFAAQLLARGALRDGETCFALQQGVEMGRISDLGLRVICRGGRLASVHVSGAAVEISRGRLRPPPRS